VHTQVVAYLEGLARKGHVIHLLTFDPALSREQRRSFAQDLASKGIAWHSLRYHKRPSLPATLFDTLAGAATAVALVRRHRLVAIHARNHVPAAMALIIRRLTGTKLIFDIRGLMAEEYADAGRWKRGGLPYRITTVVQAAAIRRADGVVMLTEAVRRHLLGTLSREPSVYVIPCCADLQRIESQSGERASVRRQLGLEQRPILVYVGKFTGRYMEREMVEFFDVARGSSPELAFLVLTQSDPDAITQEFDRLEIAPSDYRVLSAAPEQVGRYLAAADFAICFYQPAFSEIAASPTKLGEYLGAGLPVLATPGIGDVPALLQTNRVGVLLEAFTSDGYEEAASAISALAADPSSKDRCRSVASEQLSLEAVGIPRYDLMYRQVAGESQQASA
jgi:glycosyltransferase involved in cell wall biosynthesis